MAHDAMAGKNRRDFPDDIGPPGLRWQRLGLGGRESY